MQDGKKGHRVTDEPLGSHVLELQVADVVKETDDARSLVFAVPDGADIPPDRLQYTPGQFLTLRVPSDRTGCVARCYSLCSSPFTGDPLTVTVKRTDGGYASHWLCDNAHPGMRIHVLAPSGTFVPKTLDTDFLLLAAGSGITPMMSICKSALAEGSGRVVLIYANRDEKSVIFAAALRELAAKYPDRLTVVHWLESVQGLPSAAALARLAAPYTDRDALHLRARARSWRPPRRRWRRSSARDAVHIEVFKSLDSDPFAAVVIEEDDSDEAPGHRGRHARRRDARGALAAQRQAARRAARQGPRRAVLLPRGPLRRVRGAAEERRRRHGGQRRARAVGPRRRPDPGLPGQPDDPIRSKSPTTNSERIPSMPMSTGSRGLPRRPAADVGAGAARRRRRPHPTAANTSIPVDPPPRLQMHVTANCVIAAEQVLFNTPPT